MTVATIIWKHFCLYAWHVGLDDSKAQLIWNCQLEKYTWPLYMAELLYSTVAGCKGKHPERNVQKLDV